MSENNTTKEPINTKETRPETQNPAMLVKAPKLPVKVEFSQDQSEQQNPQSQG